VTAAPRRTGVTEPRPRRARRRLPRFALAAPAWTWYVLYFVVPLGVIVVYSFGYKLTAGAEGAGGIGLDRLSLDRYAEAVSPTFRATFNATLAAALTGTVLLFVIAFPLAYLLATRVPPRWRGLLLGLVIVPFWTSFLLRAVAWRIVLAPGGFLSDRLQRWHLIGAPIDVLDTRVAVQLGIVYNYLPLMVFPLFVALDRLDPALREASKDLGAGRVATFWAVTLPLAMPGIVAGLLLVYIPLMGEYVIPAVLGGAKGLMAGSLVASQFLEAQNWALGSAMAVTLLGLTLGTAAVLGLLLRMAGAVLRRRRAVVLR
jgi:spermidine/putrescine transport system permease protein